MRYRVLFVSIMAFLLSVLAVSAQEANVTRWYWSWNPDSSALLSYTTEGDTNTLLEAGLDGSDFQAWRISENSALAVMKVDSDEPQFYEITSDDLLPLTFTNPDFVMEDTHWGKVGQAGDYVVLVNDVQLPAGGALLVNLNTNTVTALPQAVAFLRYQSRFSADGRYFRYLARDPEDDYLWTIREYKLDTNTERVIYTVEDEFFPIMTSDTYGEQWLYQHNGIATFVDVSGEVTEVLDEMPTARQIVDDHLFSFVATCTEDCELTWMPLSEGTLLRFTLPRMDDGFPTAIGQIDETHLLVFAGELFWLLESDGTAEAVGAWNIQRVVTPLMNVLSPNRRFLFALDDSDSTTYHVQDLQSGQTVLESDPEREYHILQIWYGDSGFIIGEDTQYFQFYRYSDGQIFDLGEPGGIFFDAPSDQAVLYVQYRDADSRARGIYRYELESGEYVLLVEGVTPLVVQP
jgi:hypothetical protein